MADVNANIGVSLDTKQALAQLQDLQRRISTFHQSMARSGSAANVATSRNLQQNLQNNINATGQFTASLTKVKSTTETFTNALEKNKLSMGQYFRYGAASTKTFGKAFTKEMNTINKVAVERVKTMQTQYIQLGRDANGAMRAMAIRPAALDMNNLATKTAIAAQKQQIFNQLLKQGSTNLLNFGKNTQWAGRQLMVGFTIPLGIMGAAASRTFMEIEKQAVRFKRVYGDAFSTSAETEKALDDMKDLAEEFTKYGVAVEKTLGLAADAAQMGLSGRDLAAQVTNATRLAVLGEVEQQEALQTSISITNAFGISAEQLAEKINFLNAVENESVTAISDLTIAIPKAGPVIEQLGGSVEDLAFFLTAMKEGGINASEGANALKSGLAKMINPTKVARDMLQGLGIDLMEIVESNAGDIKTTVVDFAEALDTLDPLNRARAIEQLFGKFQFARISTLFKNIVAEGNQAQRVLELSQATAEELAIISDRELSRVEESPMFKFQKQLESFQAALAPIGEAFLKAVTPIIEIGTDLLRWFDGLSEGAKNFAVIAVGALGGIAPVALMGFGLIANGIANLMKLFANLRGFMLRLRNGAQDLGQGTEYLTQEQLEAQTVAASLQQSHAQLIQTFGVEETAIIRLARAYNMATTAQRGLAFQGVPGAAGVIRATQNTPMTTTGSQNPLKLAEGILSVPGPKGAGDVVAAMLSPGEAVLPADRVQKYGALIAGIMDDKVPGFQTGNVVTVPGGSGREFAVRGKSEQAVSLFIESLINAGNSIDQIEALLDSIVGGLSETSKAVSLNKTQIESAAKEAGLNTSGSALERAHLTKDLGMEGDDVRVVSNLTRDTLRSQNRALISGQDPDKFMEDWSSVKGGLFSTVSQGGLELTAEVRQAAQELDDQIGKRAQEMAKAKNVLVDDSLLAEAAQEVINENKELTNEYGQVARTLEQRGSSVGGRRGTTDEAAERLKTGGAGKTKYSVKEEAGGAGSYGRQTSRAKVLTPEEAKANRLRIEAGEKELQAANSNVDSSKTNQQSAEKGKYAAKAEADAANKNKLTAEQKAANAAEDALNEARAVGYNEEQAQQRAEAARQQVLNAEKEEQVINEKAAAVDKSEQAASVEQAAALEEQRIDDIEEQAAQQEVLAAQKQVETAEEERQLLLQLHEEEKAAKRKAYRKLESNMKLYGRQDGITSQEKSMRRKFRGDLANQGQPSALTQAQKRQIGIKANYGTDEFSQSQRWQRKLEESKMRQIKAEDRKARLAEQQVAQAQRASNMAQQETQKKRIGLGLLDRINAIRAKVASTEQMQGMQTRFGNRAMGIGMAASTVVGMGSMAQGPVGEISRQLMPAVMGISSAAMLINMLPAKMLSSFMTFLFSPMGIATAALVAVFGTLAAITISNNKAIKESKDNAYEFAKALAASRDSAKEFAEATGSVTRSEILDRRRSGLDPNIQSPEETVGEQIVQGEVGQKLVEDVNKAFESEGFETASKMLSRELNNAILQNALTVEQAKSVAEAVGAEIDNYELSVNVMASIASWTAPNGEPIDLSKPISADVALRGIGFEDLAKEGRAITQELIDTSGDFIGKWDVGRWSEISALEGEAAASQVNLLEARESGLEALDQSYMIELDRLKAAGELSEAQELQKEYEDERFKFVSSITEELQEQRRLYKELLEEDPGRAVAAKVKQRDVLIESSGNKDAIMGMAGRAGEARRKQAEGTEIFDVNELVSNETEMALYSTLLAADATENQIDLIEEVGQAHVDARRPVSEFYEDLIDYGDAFGASRVSEILNVVSGIADEAERARVLDVALNMSPDTDPRVLDIINSFGKAPEEIRVDLIVNLLGKGEEELEAIFNQIDKIANINSKDLTIGSAEDLLLTESQRDILRSDVDYFNSLDLSGKKIYLETILISGIDETDVSDAEARASIQARTPIGSNIEITQESIDEEKSRIKAEFVQDEVEIKVATTTDLQGAQAAVRDLVSSDKLDARAEIIIDTLLADDDIGEDVVNLINTFSEDPATIKAFVNLRTRMGGQNTEEVLGIISGISDTQQKANFINYIVGLSVDDPAAAQEAIGIANNLVNVKDFAGEDIDALIDLSLSDPTIQEDLKDVNGQIDSIIEQSTDQDQIEINVVRNLLGDEVGDIIAEDQAYFDALPKDQQITYTQVLATLAVTAGVKVQGMSDAEVMQEAASQGLFGTFGPGGVDPDYMRGILLDRELEKVRDAVQASMADFEFTTPTGRTGSDSGGEQLSTTLDGLLDQLRQFVSLGVDVREGWDAALQEIEDFANGSSNVFNGLSQQLRSLGASQPLIDLIVGMDPEEFEEKKNKLFKIENGQIVGLKNAALAIGEALNAVKIGSFLDEQQAQLDNTASQESAFQKLVDAGVDVAQAYKTIQNEALAAAIASTNLTDVELKELADRITEVSENMQIAEALESARTSISDFEDDLKLRYDIEAYIDSPEFDTLTESIENGFVDGSVASAAILKDESLKALIEAGQQGGEEFADRLLQLLSSPQFLQGIFDEGYSNVQEAFGVQADNIARNFEDALQAGTLGDLSFADQFGLDELSEIIGVTEEELKDLMSIADPESVVFNAEQQIAAINYQIDDFQAGLKRIELEEESINDKYDERIEALEDVNSINDSLARQQKAQLTIADALTRGDIAAAAKAVQEQRAAEAAARAESQKERIEEARQRELEAIAVDINGQLMSREEIEQRIKDLELEIFNIEEDRLEPAQRLIELSETLLSKQLEYDTVLGKTEEQWIAIKSAVDNAKISSDDFVDSMKAAENTYLDLVNAYADPPQYTPPEPEPEPEPEPTPDPEPEPTPEPEKPKYTTYTVKSGDTLSGIASKFGVSLQDIFDANPIFKSDPKYMGGNRIFRGTKVRVPTFAGGGMPSQSSSAGQVGYYPMGGLIPYMSVGGMFQSINTDTVPAMLSAGEFVVRRSAVDKYGKDMLKSVNNGTYNGESVYNYSVNVNVKSDANASDIAKTVMSQIKQIDSQRMRSNRF